MTKVKICGITNLEDALHAVECGADMLGFNFYRGSKRYIELSTATEILAKLGDVPIDKVGVFVNADLWEVAKFAGLVGLDTIQLHGDEDDGYVEQLRRLSQRSVINAFRASSRSAFAAAVNSLATYVLLDSYSADHLGGTGVAFDWELAREVVTLLPGAVYLAGGLTPENVADAVRTVRPYAVDVASGVESSPGKKDPEKVAAFIRAAKEAL